MDLIEKLKEFRTTDRNVYPELIGYSKNQLYENMIGCGGLYLAAKMLRQMNIKKGDILLDLGCGFGTTSLFLAKYFDVTVIAADLWNPPEIIAEKALKENLSNRIIPICLDITQTIPFAENYFDAIFCMNSLFMFGDHVEFLSKLLKVLKPGGNFCLGSECFNQEPNYKNKDEVPKVYNFEWEWSVWESCFSKYHYPQWWESLFRKTNMLDISYCQELNDGVILWEDSAVNYYDYYSKVLSLGAMIPQERLVDMILYGKQNVPYTTLFILAGIRK